MYVTKTDHASEHLYKRTIVALPLLSVSLSNIHPLAAMLEPRMYSVLLDFIQLVCSFVGEYHPNQLLR